MTTLRERVKAFMAPPQAQRPAVRPAPSLKAADRVQLWSPSKNNTPLWTEQTLQSFIDYGFNINAVIYAAATYRADSVNSAMLRAYEGTLDDAAPLSHTAPLSRLLVRPNSFQSSHEFHALNTVYFALAGQSFVWFRRAKANTVPTAMYTLRPDWVRIVPSEQGGEPLVGYVYAPNGNFNKAFPLLPEDVAHIKRPNPSDPLMGAGYGFSPMNSLSQSGNVDNEVTAFLKVFFESGAMFQNAVAFDGDYTDEELARVRERLREIYGGVENWNEWAVLGGGAKIERVSPTFEEMGFDGIDSRNEARMLMALGVPPILVGARLGLERSTFSNYEEARRAFWEDRLLPELKMFESEYQWYLGDDNTFVRYDLSDVPALRRDVVMLTEAAKNLVEIGVPPRLALNTVGLDVEEYEGDMERLIASGSEQLEPASLMEPVGTDDGAKVIVKKKLTHTIRRM